MIDYLRAEQGGWLHGKNMKVVVRSGTVKEFAGLLGCRSKERGGREKPECLSGSLGVRVTEHTAHAGGGGNRKSHCIFTSPLPSLHTCVCTLAHGERLPHSVNTLVPFASERRVQSCVGVNALWHRAGS